MSRPTKIAWALLVTVIVGIGVAVLVDGRDTGPAPVDTAYHSPATLERIRADVADGLALGVQGTPTFFLDGQRLQPETIDDLTQALHRAANS